MVSLVFRWLLCGLLVCGFVGLWMGCAFVGLWVGCGLVSRFVGLWVCGLGGLLNW